MTLGRPGTYFIWPFFGFIFSRGPSIPSASFSPFVIEFGSCCFHRRLCPLSVPRDFGQGQYWRIMGYLWRYIWKGDKLISPKGNVFDCASKYITKRSTWICTLSPQYCQVGFERASWAMQHTWLLLSFSPFHVRHPLYPLCSSSKYLLCVT